MALLKAMKAKAMKATPKAMKAKRKTSVIKAKKGKTADKYPTNSWTKGELAILKKLNTPEKIQEFIDTLGYDPEDDYFSVRSTLRTRRAHCAGGALLAACCLERLGLGPPLVVGFEAKNDDSHAVAVYKKNGYWGAVGKSNFTLIRSRFPVYRTQRELMMSYYDMYFNTARQQSLYAYTKPFNLNPKGQSWKFAPGSLGHLLDDFDDVDKCPLVHIFPQGTKKPKHGLASKAVLNAGLLGSNPAGLFKPN